MATAKFAVKTVAKRVNYILPLYDKMWEDLSQKRLSTKGEVERLKKASCPPYSTERRLFFFTKKVKPLESEKRKWWESDPDVVEAERQDTVVWRRMRLLEDAYRTAERLQSLLRQDTVDGCVTLNEEEAAHIFNDIK